MQKYREPQDCSQHVMKRRNSIMKAKLFNFTPDNTTLVGIVSGILMIVLSITMNVFPDNVFAHFVLRNILMIYILGFVFPLYFILYKEKRSLSILGIHTKKIRISLVINLVAAAALLAIFIKEKSTPIVFTREHFFAIVYIFVAGVFEMLFIYGFLRYEFEKAFGIIPAIILTAFFYSLHHAGFQPEFVELFFVGILYTTVFYSTRNLFCIFPFFWGVGAVWDVLVDSDAGNRITNKTSFVISIVLIMCMLITAILIYRVRKHKPIT